jgi:hypothetical protein
MKKLVFGLVVGFFCQSLAWSQTTVVGKVTDAETGDPIPFANVIVPGIDVGTATDFEGNFKLSFQDAADSIKASYVGYEYMVKSLTDETEQVINFQLFPTAYGLSEFVFEAGENPAYPILRKVVANKEKFDKRGLKAYESDNYTKIEIDIDQISDRLKEKKMMTKVIAVLDSIKMLTDDEGQRILPVFLSESISRFYYRDNPKLTKEEILNTRVSGVGITDGTTISQITGSVFQEYNFYKNWLTILEKDFVSPIADGWKGFYDYDLTDSIKVGGDSCYVLQVYPLRKQDLAFSGTIWINMENYSLKQVDLSIPEEANINFVDLIKIQQELIPTSAGPSLPVKSRVLVKVGKLSPGTAGFFAKFYSSSKNIMVDKPRPTSFFDKAIDLKLESPGDGDYWEKNRHDPLSEEELVVFQMVDTLKNIPVIKFYSESLLFLASGYHPVGKFDLGPWTGLFNYNNIEGVRLGMGARTNYKFSKKWVFDGYMAHGFADQEWKYDASVTRILDRNKWTTATLRSQKEIDQVGLKLDDLQNNAIFLAVNRFGTLRRPYYSHDQSFTFQRDLFKGFTFSGSLRHSRFEPVYNFYYLEKDSRELEDRFQYTEAKVSLRYGRDEIFLINDNYRISLGPSRWPIFTFDYAKGIPALGGDISYDKYSFSVYQKLNMGMLGVSRYEFSAGMIAGEVPYPLLENHLGNETLFYTTAAYNLMDFFEFASDQYVSLRYRHHFEGFLLNKIPLIKKLKWRAGANANVLYGSVSDKNILNSPTVGPHGQDLTTFGKLDPIVPYVEVGYGIENIFKFFRVDAFHRLTYLDQPDVRRFGVKVSAQFIL